MTRSRISGKARIGSTVIGSLEVEVRQAGLAGQARPAVDLGAARAALGGLAVPADGEVRRLVALDPVEGVEDDHPLLDRDVELVERDPAPSGLPRKTLRMCVGHRCAPSSVRCCRAGRGARRASRAAARSSTVIVAVAARDDDAVAVAPGASSVAGIVEPAVGAAALRALRGRSG